MWVPARNRWLVEIRYPNGSRLRKRLRREREALRLWVGEQAKIENGTWDERAARNITVAAAMEVYRAYSEVQHRSHNTYVLPSLALWEQNLGPDTHLAKVTSHQIEDFKLNRAQKVTRSTTDKDLTVLKAFFNWCIAYRLAVSNPVRRVKLCVLKSPYSLERLMLLPLADKLSGRCCPSSFRCSNPSGCRCALEPHCSSKSSPCDTNSKSSNGHGVADLA